MRYYEPDFVGVLTDQTRSVVGMKGREYLNVAHKDRAAEPGGENATLLTGELWRYVKLPQTEFEKLDTCGFTYISVFESGGSF